MKLQPAQHEVALLQDRVYRKLHAVLSRETATFGINLSEWTILGQLDLKKELTATQIAELMSVEAPYIARMLRLLESKQLIESSPHPEDKRSRYVRATEKGKAMVASVEKHLRPFSNSIAKKISLRASLNYFKSLQAIDSISL